MISDYQLISTARDHASTHYEVYFLDSLMDRLRQNPERKIGESYRAFATEILDRTPMMITIDVPEWVEE